jgi:hypothetical protein
MTTPKLPSKRASSFKKLYGQLPERVQHTADEAYGQFRADPDYPGLNFKHIVGAYYSARVGSTHRALAVLRGDHWLRFWISSHADYDTFLDQLRKGRRGV